MDDDELAGVVATHYIEAHNAAPEGPDADALAARACDALVTAGERAGSLGSHQQSLSYFEQAAAVTPSAEERIGLLEHAADAALSDRAEVNDTLGWIYFKKGNVREALPLLRVAADLYGA